ncbi:MAG TPA: SDR family NAD(P)-dependent oxidoreductase [Pyrinomonadaceae bacterium]|nr:SDR family NAD(P)-dependent oxidoreductase [Pyrinomonadaceae bacterium]
MQQQSTEVNHSNGSEIAIIGMACRFPGARGVEQFWRNLRDGVESLVPLSDEELSAAGVSPQMLANPNYVKAGMILDDVEMFDASFFGYNPREAEVMDPQQRFFLECAWEALEDGGYNGEKYKGSVGVYAGVGANTYLFNLSSDSDLARTVGSYQTIISNDKDFLATRVSYKLNLKGPSLAVQTACSTSLVAAHLACQSLLNGECDMALAGGVSIRLPQKAGYLFEPEMIHSPDGHCRAFDAKAQGPSGGNGVGVVLFKRLSDAVRDGDNIYAVVKGSAINNDGALKVGYTAPSVEGQARVIAEALGIAGVNARTVSFIEAHGTATALGDPIEIAALTKAYRAYTQEKNFCAIGSVKTNIGHLDTAAGVAGLIKAALSLKHKQIPPSLHFEKPNPKIDFESSPFYVNSELVEWERNGTPRRAGVSSFGMGGTNAHLVLEEAPVVESSEAERPWQLLTLSARTASALEAATDNLADYFERHEDVKLADAAYTLQLGRKTFNNRRMLVCRDLDDARKALKSRDPQRVFTSVQESSARPVVFMFPGGGAQYVEMGQELYRTERVFREEVDRCMELLKPHVGSDLRELLYPSEERTEEAHRLMERTSVALPALFTIEYALSRLLMSWGVRPQAMIGHSLGEYAAACIAGVISLEDALALVALRGRLFEQLPEGSMLSVPLSEEELRPFLGKKLSIAAVNGPSLCVVSGATSAIEELEKTLADNSVEVGRLHIAVAAHSEMVTPILDEFRTFVESIKLNAPEIPYISTLTGTWIKAEEVTRADYWAQHLRQTVRFGEGLRVLWSEEDRILLEVGPGQTLSTLARQHADKPAGQVILSSLRHPHEQQSDVAFLLTALGRLWIAGARVEWQGLYAGERRTRVGLPTYPFESQRYWIESQPMTSVLAQPSAATAGRKREPSEWFYLPSWKRSLRQAAKADDEAERVSWLLLADGRGIAARVAERLREEGHAVVLAEMGEEFASTSDDFYIINHSRAEDFRELLKELRLRDQLPQRIVHLWSLGPIVQPLSETELLNDELERGFYSLVQLTQSLEKEGLGGRLEITVVSNGLHDITGEEPLCPQKNTVLGPCVVIPQEYPNITCRSIDVILPTSESEQERELVNRLISELRSEPSEQTLALRNNHRWAQAFEPVRLEEESPAKERLRENGVYLIIGGLGDVGHILATHIAKTKGVRLVLTGRTALPPREDWDEWLAANGKSEEASSVETCRRIQRALQLEEAGAEVLVASADVADPEQMKRLVDDVEARFGGLNGVIMAAGASKEKAFCTIQETTPGGGEWFRSKAEGLLVLDEVLGDRELDFCLLTSSLSSILGGLGHVSYTASNLFMDAFAQSRSREGRVGWTSINWEGWQPVEEMPAEFNLASAQLQLTLTPSEGMNAFGRILSSTEWGAQAAVSTSDLQGRIDEWVRRKWLFETEGAGGAARTGTLHKRPELANAYVAPETELQSEIVTIWQSLIGIEDIGIHDNFFELGGSSLLATQLISRLRDKLQVELTLRSFFEAPTVAGLAEAVKQAREQGTQAPVPAIPRIPRRGQVAMLSSDGVLTIPELLKPEIPVEAAPTENP